MPNIIEVTGMSGRVGDMVFMDLTTGLFKTGDSSNDFHSKDLLVGQLITENRIATEYPIGTLVNLSKGPEIAALNGYKKVEQVFTSPSPDLQVREAE